MTCRNGQIGTYRSTARHGPFKLGWLTSGRSERDASAAGTDWTNLYGLAVTRNGTVWAVGTYLDKPRGDNNNALILRGRGASWTVDHGPDPGSGGNILGGVADIGGQVWAAGSYDNGGSELPLLERR